LLQFLDAYFEPRIREVLGLAEEWLSRAGRTAVEDALAEIDRALGRAEAELTERHAWSGAYSRLLTLRTAIG